MTVVQFKLLSPFGSPSRVVSLGRGTEARSRVRVFISEYTGRNGGAGDTFIFCMTKRSRWIGVLTVEEGAFEGALPDVICFGHGQS